MAASAFILPFNQAEAPHHHLSTLDQITRHIPRPLQGIAAHPPSCSLSS
jgi:hypothetical protein